LKTHGDGLHGNTPIKEHVMKIQTLLSTAILLAFSSLAMAQAPSTATPRIDKREAHQQQRIANGAASGQLTAKETAHLEKRETKISTDEAAAKADGTVTKAERIHLRREENRANRAVHRQKHDAQKAPAAS
jgi:hypothetical protein